MHMFEVKKERKVQQIKREGKEGPKLPCCVVKKFENKALIRHLNGNGESKAKNGYMLGSFSSQDNATLTYYKVHAIAITIASAMYVRVLGMSVYILLKYMYTYFKVCESTLIIMLL